MPVCATQRAQANITEAAARKSDLYLRNVPSTNTSLQTRQVYSGKILRSLQTSRRMKCFRPQISAMDSSHSYPRSPQGLQRATTSCWPGDPIRGIKVARKKESKPQIRMALDGIDLDVAPGQIFGLLGPNGAGKSTTVGILTTRVRPTSGTGVDRAT